MWVVFQVRELKTKIIACVNDEKHFHDFICEYVEKSFCSNYTKLSSPDDIYLSQYVPGIYMHIGSTFAHLYKKKIQHNIGWIYNTTSPKITQLYHWYIIEIDENMSNLCSNNITIDRCINPTSCVNEIAIDRCIDPTFKNGWAQTLKEPCPELCINEIATDRCIDPAFKNNWVQTLKEPYTELCINEIAIDRCIDLELCINEIAIDRCIDLESCVEIELFSFDEMIKAPKICIIGVRGTGKSYIVRHLIQHLLKSDDYCDDNIIISAPDKLYRFYDTQNSRACIYYDYRYAPFDRLNENISKKLKYIVIEDAHVYSKCISECQQLNCSNDAIIITIQTPFTITRKMFDFDYIIITRSNDINIKKIHDIYLKNIISLDAYRKINDVYTKNYNFLILDVKCTSTNITDKLFYYRIQ